MTQQEFTEWIQYETQEEQRVKKLDVYMGQIISLLHCMCNPGKRYNAKDVIIGDIPEDQA